MLRCLSQVLKYSQVDMNRIRKELELQFEARYLTKERDWMNKYKEQEEEIMQLQAHSDRHRKSQEEMKWVCIGWALAITTPRNRVNSSSSDGFGH